MTTEQLDRHRDFLKDTLRLQLDFSQTDQRRGVPGPPLQKPAGQGARVDLIADGAWSFADLSVIDAVRGRRSRRAFSDQPLSLEELSFLLWMTQGVQRRLGPETALRTVPSAGARHAFETYLCVFRVEGLEPGVYHYLPFDDQLELLDQPEGLGERVVAATLGQIFTAKAAVTLVWSVIPYRMEWRYGLAAHRVLGYDVGHVCQNLYLGCEVIGAGTCAVAAFDQERLDHLLGLDGHDEFAMYLAAVGKRRGR